MVPVTESKEIKKSPAAKLDKSIKIGGYKDQKPTGDKDLVEVINNKKEQSDDRNIKEKKEDKPKSPISVSPKPSVSSRPSQSPNASRPTTPQNEVKVKESNSQNEVKDRENKYSKDSLNTRPRSETASEHNSLQRKKSSSNKPIKNNPQPDAKFRK